MQFDDQLIAERRALVGEAQLDPSAISLDLQLQFGAGSGASRQRQEDRQQPGSAVHRWLMVALLPKPFCEICALSL